MPMLDSLRPKVLANMTKNICDFMEIVNFQVRHVNHIDCMESGGKAEGETHSIKGWDAAMSHAQRMLSQGNVV